ncbi:MAG: TonB-dependent receptor [Bryobacteraceae bacterium]
MSHSNWVRIATLTLVAAGLLAQEQGTVSGTVFDAQTSRPIPGVKIGVNGQFSDQQVTDTDGRFTIKLAPGKYTINYQAPNYLDSETTDFEVAAGQSVDGSTVMAAKGSVTTVDVVERITPAVASAEAMLTERRLSAVVSDGMSKEEIRNTTASSAAGALEKVTGVSIVESGYVYVRGLGERYSATMLNAAMIPTTEPEKRVVPLDLFPAGLIDSIKVLKTYTPDLPAEFSGGLVQMQTVEFPTAKMLSVSTNIGFNSRTTFDRFASYPGGGRDFFGFDDGTRSLPSSIPTDKRLFQGAFTPQQFQQFGQALPNNWEPEFRDSMRPAQSYSVVGGGTFGRFGLVGAVSFSNKPQFQSETQKYLRQQGTRPLVFSDYTDFRSYTETARLGAVFNAAMRLNAANKLVLRNTITRDTDKEAREFTGRDGGTDSTLFSQRLRFIERGLLSTSLEGEHALASLGNSLFKWQMTYSRSTRNEPDLREVFRGLGGNDKFQFAALGSSGLRFYNDLTDKIYEPQAEFSRPFFRGKVSGIWKFGFRGTFRDRDFQARRFRFIPQRLSTIDTSLPSNQLFGPSNIRPDGFQLVEFTRATDRYDASMDIYAGYGLVDLAFGSRWRLVGGVRVEDADIRVTTLDPLVPQGQPQVANLANRDPAPGVNLIYALTNKQNLRLSYSHTVSRPDFRELSPFDFNNVLGGFVSQGNPNLLRATVHNVDARWEWFLGGNQILAASWFYKDFSDPIEVNILFANDLRQSYINAAGARNTGFELEARKSLSFLSRQLADFSVQGNFTLVDSQVRIRAQDAAALTSLSRPMMGQSRFVYNAIAEWNRPKWRSNARFYANSVSRRITEVGTFGLPDIYQERNTFLDLVYQLSLTETGKWSLRFNAENLGDNKYRWTQGDFLVRNYQLGRTFSVGVSYQIF